MAKNEHPNAAGVAARAKTKDEQNAEYYAREEAMKPTPTQEENDLAKVGALDHDSKEDDGSEWDADMQRRVMEGRLPGNSPYDVRSVDAGGSEDSAAPRRGRRAKADE